MAAKEQGPMFIPGSAQGSDPAKEAARADAMRTAVELGYGEEQIAGMGQCSPWPVSDSHWVAGWFEGGFEGELQGLEVDLDIGEITQVPCIPPQLTPSPQQLPCTMLYCAVPCWLDLTSEMYGTNLIIILTQGVPFYFPTNPRGPLLLTQGAHLSGSLSLLSTKTVFIIIFHPKGSDPCTTPILATCPPRGPTISPILLDSNLNLDLISVSLPVQ